MRRATVDLRQFHSTHPEHSPGHGAAAVPMEGHRVFLIHLCVHIFEKEMGLLRVLGVCFYKPEPFVDAAGNLGK